jgi:nucleoside-diphosphate-sugar epimerase
MRVFVAGGTGTLGRPVVRLLVAGGHEVRAHARTPDRELLLRSLGAEPVVAEFFDARAMTAAIDGCEAILHLATRIPPLAKMRKAAAWRDNDQLRSHGASILVNAGLAVGARVYVQESITFLYRGLGDTWLYETAPIDAPQPLASARDAERETARFSARGGQGVVLRFGLFYSADAPSTRETVRLARWRLFPILGPGDHFVSSVHVDDAAAAVVAALGIPAGIYNVADDEPVPMRAYVGALTDAFGFRPAWHLPLAIARRLFGPSVEVFTRSQRVATTMFKAVSSWAPRHPNVREGWRAVARDMAVTTP